MDRLQYIIEQYAANRATDAEVKEFFSLLKTMENDESVKAMLMQLLENTDGSTVYNKERWDALLQKVLRPEAPLVKMHSKRFFNLTRVAAAAVIILLFSVAGYFYFNKTNNRQQAPGNTANLFKNDIAPGGNKAILTLANGQKIILNSAANGTLTQQGNTKIIKLDSGQLAYRESGSSQANGGRAGVGLNTISTPKGGQYQIVLADGSKVWLNAASSLRFPTAFTGKERNVELTGEGYFEVAHNAKMPFHVSIASPSGDGRGVRVEVLGTHFNINAYDDETSIKTTLLEGSVKVSRNDESKMLKPNEQMLVAPNSPLTIDHSPNIDEVIAWKNGLFRFESQDLETIMRQLSRWYDVEVNYKVKTNRHFTGIISRNVNASEVLKMLEMAGGMHFTIDGKKVIVEK